MVNPSANPFVLPGFGQSGDFAQNPMMASLEMMRQAWQNMAGGALDHSLMAAPMSPEELERRIKDLRAVENWLRMNLSMLSSTIQGLEVQKATLTTLRSFVATASASGGSAAEALSPLEVVLGIRKPGQAAPAAPFVPSASAWPEFPAKSASVAGAAQASTAPAPEAPTGSAAEPAGTPGDAALAGAAAAAQGWWDMLQKQFDTLAAATSATLQSAEAMKATAARTETPDASSQAPSEAASANPAPSARRSVAKKAVPRKTTARKTAAK